MLYQTYQAQADLLCPWRLLNAATLSLLESAPAASLSPLAQLAPLAAPALADTTRRLQAFNEVFAQTRVTHLRPAFGITRVASEGREFAVREEVALALPFGDLLRFRKEALDADAANQPAQPRVLIVAPMSGHFATLLRETVRTMLADHDVYITDWRNARDVALTHGRFGFDDYIVYLMAFIEHLGRGAHVLAVCQPCVATLAAAALMAQDDNPCQPRSLTLMAGPVDCRISPTRVNELATGKPLHWFEANLLTHVPLRYAGAMRRVYPGFLQLAAFMSMNFERHQKAFMELYDCLREGADDAMQKAAATKVFYEEYFAVADLPAEFYLETIDAVFQRWLLPRGELHWRGRRVEPAAIRRTALLTVEGEKDDICAVGQTMAAHDLCSGIRPYLKQHHVQTGVGHYGVFSGRRWQQQIYPLIRDMIHVMDGMH